MVDAQEGEGAVKSIAPAHPDRSEGIGEVLFQNPVNAVVCRGVEVAGDEGGDAWVGGVLLESVEDNGKFDLAEGPVLAVLMPAIAPMKV